MGRLKKRGKMSEEINTIIPNSMTKLRACMRCHLVKSEAQFKHDGCENCPFFKGSDWEVHEFTNANFEGVVSIMNCEDSWVSKRLDVNTFQPGCYCLKIYGDLPEDVINYF